MRPEYDLNELRARAAVLQRRARTIVGGRTIGGTLVGAALAAMLALVQLAVGAEDGSGHDASTKLAPVSGSLILVATLIGYWDGQLRAVPYEVEAFKLLHQVQIEAEGLEPVP